MPRCVLMFLYILGLWYSAFWGATITKGEINPRQLTENIFYGPAPTCAADYGRLRQLGICQIIDLRTFKKHAFVEEEQTAQTFGMRYCRIAIGFTPQYPDAEVEAVLRRLNCIDQGAVYFHCNLGKDRTGLIAGLYRHRYLGCDARAVYRVMLAEDFNPKLRQLDAYYWDSAGR